MAKLVLVRHGQSQWNLENRFTGWVDVELTPQGEQEAKRAGQIRFERARAEILDEPLRGARTVPGRNVWNVVIRTRISGACRCCHRRSADVVAHPRSALPCGRNSVEWLRHYIE